MTETKTEGNIIINVRLFCTKKPDLKYLTRFQCKMPWEVRGKTLRLKLNPEVDTVATLKKKVEETRGTHAVESLCKGGAPYGIVLEPDTATLASVGLTRSHSVWEYLWEDSEAEQALFQEELDKVRGYVHEFMLKHPDMKGGRNTGEKQPEEETWSKKQRRKRTEMEKAVAAYRGGAAPSTSVRSGQKTPECVFCDNHGSPRVHGLTSARAAAALAHHDRDQDRRQHHHQRPAVLHQEAGPQVPHALPV